MNKLNLVVLPTQQGKTFTAINEIVQTIENDVTKNYLHIVFTMNTILNNRQFSGRLSIIGEKYGENSIIEFSSSIIKGKNHVSTLDELNSIAGKEKKPYVIVVCTNGKRIKNINTFLESFHQFTYDKVNIYFDEIHKYIDKLRPLIENIINYDFVHKIIGLTATPGRLWNVDWLQLNIHNIEYNSDNYISLADHQYELIPFLENYDKPAINDYETHEKNILDFAKHCFDNFPQLIDKNSKTFIPSHVRLSSHYEMKELILNNWPDSVVVVLNGREKSITYLRDDIEYETVPFSKNKKETSDEIFDILTRYKLFDRPLFITGFLCIGMGQTLVNESLGPFTHAVISHLDHYNDEIYQLMGRTTGRMKHWKTWTQTKVLTTQITKERALAMQECALNMINFRGKFANKEDYNKPMEQTDDKIKNNVKRQHDKSNRVVANENNSIIPIKITFENKKDVSSREKFIQFLKNYIPEFYDTVKDYKIHLHGFRVNADYLKKSFNTVITAYNENKYVVPPGKHSVHNDSNHIFLYLNSETNNEAYICIWKN